jgi:hypothetical protein
MPNLHSKNRMGHSISHKSIFFELCLLLMLSLGLVLGAPIIGFCISELGK